MQIGLNSAAIAASALAITWFVYPCAIFVGALVRRSVSRRVATVVSTSLRSVSVVVATRDSPSVVQRRVRNLLGTAPVDQMTDIVVAVDRTSSSAVEEYRRVLPSAINVVVGDGPGGKACALNAGVRACKNEIVVFADSAQTFRDEAVAELLKAFDDSTVGAASGTLFPENNRRSVVLRLFWRYESWLRRTESTFDSLVGVTGAIYAIRREVWRPMPPGLLLDDVYVAFAVVEQGLRVVQVDNAVAVDGRSFTADEEFTRRVRTQTGLLQICALKSSILLPCSSRIWLQFLCHKLARTMTPFLLTIIFVGVISAWMSLVTTLAIAVIVLAGWVVARAAPSESLVGRARRQLRWAFLLLAAPVIAIYHALAGKWDVWKPDDNKA